MKTDENVCIWMNLDAFGWHWMKMDEIGWNKMKLDEFGWKWMTLDEYWWNLMKIDEIGWKLMKLVEIGWNCHIIPNCIIYAPSTRRGSTKLGLAFLTNIRLRWVWMKVTSTLAYCSTDMIAAAKRLIGQALGPML